MQAGVGLLVSHVMPIYMIIPRYSHNYAQFCQWLNSNLFTHRKILMLLREATSETYGPRVYLHHINLPILSYFLCFFTLLLFYFASLSQKYQKYYFTIYPSLSYLTLQITVKGLTTPLSRWVQVGVCLCRYSVDCRVVSYWIDTLVLKTEGNTYATLLHHPFLFKGKTNASSRGSTRHAFAINHGRRQSA